MLDRLARAVRVVGCAEQVRELAPYLFQLCHAGVRTVFVGSGSVEQRAAFAARNALEGAPASLVTDPSLGLYRALRLVRSAWATLGPRALFDTARAMAAGHRHRGAEGDRMQQGGVLLVSRVGCVRLLYRSRSIGDYPPPRSWSKPRSASLSKSAVWSRRSEGATMVVFIHIANVIYLCSYLVKNILWLRVLTVVAGSVLLGYYLWMPTPVWAIFGSRIETDAWMLGTRYDLRDVCNERRSCSPDPYGPF